MTTRQATKSHDGIEYTIKELLPGHGRWEWSVPDAPAKGEVQGTWGAAEALAKDAINRWLAEERKRNQRTFADT
jgi:hypothetical protein